MHHSNNCTLLSKKRQALTAMEAQNDSQADSPLAAAVAEAPCSRLVENISTTSQVPSGSNNPTSSVGIAVMSDASRGRRGHGNNTSHTVRWYGLASMCLLMTAEYYSIDIPAALHQDLKDYMADSSDSTTSEKNFELHFNLLYSVYSIPNVVLPLFGGFLVDRWGPSLCMIGYSLCLCFGQALFATGLAQKSWSIMLLGRTVFGLGGESICVANSTMLSDWFDPSERAFAFGTLLAISRMGSVLNNLISPGVAHTLSTPWAGWVGASLNMVGVVAACFVNKLVSKCNIADAGANEWHSSERVTRLSEPLLQVTDEVGHLEMERAQDSDREREADPNLDPTLPISTAASSSETTTPDNSLPGVNLGDIGRLGSIFWLLCISCMVVYGCIMPFNNVASGVLLERNFFRAPPQDCVLTNQRQCTAGSLVITPNPSVDSLGRSCPGKGYAPVLPTLPLNESSKNYDPVMDTKIACDNTFWAEECTQDFCNALHQATETAGRIMSIPYAVSAIMSPPIGVLVDRVGHRAILAFGTSMTLLVVHLVLAFAPIHAIPVWIPLLGQGIAYALFSAVIWPSVGMVVEKKYDGDSVRNNSFDAKHRPCSVSNFCCCNP